MSNPQAPQELNAAPVAPTTTSLSVKNKRMFILGAVLLLIIVVVGVVGFSLYRVYKQAASDPLTTTVARALNLPAFKINDDTVSYSDYVDDLRAIHHVQQYSLQQTDVEGNPVSKVPTLSEQQMQDQVIQRLVQDAIVEQLARKYNATVTKEELEAYRKSVLEQRGVTTTAAADAILTSMYGWNLATYEHKVMRPVVLYQKVAAKVQSDPETEKQIRSFALDRARFVLSGIKSDQDFVQAAMLYGEDGTAQSGGDLGWFGRGDMQADFEKAAFGLAKGEMTTEPVETPYGFHIIKVEDKRVTKEKDAKTGKTIDKEEVKARHILITSSLDKFLEMSLKQSNFQFYLPLHNPFEKK